MAGIKDIAAACGVSVTTVSVPNYERGLLAMQSLSDIIEGTGGFENFKIGARVKWRKSIRHLT